MDLDQEFIELYEGWKKGKYTIKDKNGKILGTYNSGSKARKAMDDLMQKGDYDKLEVSLVEAEVKHECPKCKGEGCEHCDGKGYHVEDEDDDPVGKVAEAVNLKKLKKEYEENEDKNYHRENYLLLAKAFGTKAEIKKVEEIMKRSEKSGSTSKADNDWMYDNINKYYDKIRNEEVKVKKEETKTAKKESKLFSHVRNLMKK